ncbi:MAG: aminoacyl-tRNA hydrolase [Candidatus Omnitrophica bacterium]|nr:aminoacyl-tRNA hydrolase [Candidatus Omnitrophota bacterium]
MRIIVGLGNPGLEYRSTKHNIGFEVVLALAKVNKIKINKATRFSILGKGKIGGVDLILALPQTYMNLSGKAVGELFGREAKDISDLLIICDDVNIELGRIRLKKEGSSGGHKGLESIIHTLGRSDFARLRVGIATDVHKGDITGYVLAPFKRSQRRNVAHVIALAGDAVTCLIEEGIDKAMTKFNKRKIGAS